MRPYKSKLCLSFCCCCFFLFLIVLAGQAATGQDIGELKPGAVVARVLQRSEAEKAGIHEGDILLRWARADLHGEILSPFDLITTEIEQEPRGAVTLEGLRGTEKRTWTLGPDTWGIQARPAFSESLLAIYSEGRQLATAGKRAQAEESWRAVVNHEQGAVLPWLRPWVLVHIAEMQTEARQWKESDAAYQEAVQSAANAGAEVQAHVLRAWARTYQQRSDWPNTERYYQQSITENKKLSPESLIIAANLEDLGTVARLRGDPAKAEAYYRQALAIRQKLAPGSLDVARSFNNLGNVAWLRGDMTAAEEYHGHALEIRQRLAPGSLSVSYSFNGLGLVAWWRGDLTKAEAYLRQALEIKQRLVPGTVDFASSLVNLGSLAVQRGDLARAETYQLQALEINQRLAPGSLDVATPLINLANVASDRGDLGKAEKYLRQALEIRERLAPGSLDVASSLNNLGELFKHRGDLTKAEEYLRQALEIKQRLAPGSLNVASSLSNLGELVKDQGDLAGAEEYLRQALEIKQKLAPGGLDVAYTLYILGEIAKDQGDLEKAEEYFRQASAIRGRLAPGSKEHAEYLAALAEILRRKGDPDSAEQSYEQALNALEGQTARLGGAEDVRAGFRARHGKYYRDYLDLLVTQGNPEFAFQVLERSRAQTMLETLAAARVDIRRGADPQLLEKQLSLQADIRAKRNRRVRLLEEKRSEEQIKSVEKEISNLTAEYQEIEAQIRSRSPEYAALTKPHPLSAKQVQEELLDSDTLLLEYSLGEERSHVFVISFHSLKVVDLPKRDVIEKESQRVYDVLTERNRRTQGETPAAKAARIARAEAEYPGAAAQLSKTILGPVAKLLTRKRLLIVGDGALHYVPFAALPLSLRGKPLAPLAAEHEIITLPSASVLAALRRERRLRKAASKTIAVLADPVFDRGDIRVKTVDAGHQTAGTKTVRAANETSEEQEESRTPANLMRSAADLGWEQERNGEVYLPRLQFSRQEATDITTLAPAGQSLKALDFKASRTTAVSPDLANYRTVHFATHALVNNEHPELSGLVLSLVDEQGKPQNGFLDLEDIYNLDLPAELVVLSACETGLGKRIEGEGLVGLTRGFMYAGANRVVASLWKIDDRATAELMKGFYRALLGQGMRPAAALRAAQVQMRNSKRWSSPYYWAAFQIQGEWR